MREPGSARRGALLVACALACGMACAQPPLPPSTAASAAERAQKESDRTMYWIRVVATRPAPAKAAPTPPAVAAVAAARPASEPRERKAAAVQAPATTAAAAARRATEPVALAHASTPAQASAVDTPEPSALSSRAADSAAATVASTEAGSAPDSAPGPAPEPDPGLVQVKSVQPEFPTAVVERLRKGHVEVRFEVEPGGTVVDAAVVSTSSPRLDIAAVEAIKQWRFKPTSAFHTAMVDLVFDVNKWN